MGVTEVIADRFLKTASLSTLLPSPNNNNNNNNNMYYAYGAQKENTTGEGGKT